MKVSEMIAQLSKLNRDASVQAIFDDELFDIKHGSIKYDWKSDDGENQVDDVDRVIFVLE